MEGTKNINKKLLITIFTFLFLIRFIFSVYPQATSPQNNAASSLESNSIIQWIINSSVSGYSTAGQYLANFLSINGVPSDVWPIIVFLMTTLFFIGIYTFIFEIFVRRIGSNEETTTMKKAKILFIFALSLFSAISIGYAIPFLFSLYGFVLLIVLLIVLFFFGRAIVSYGKIFHHSVDLFAAQVKKSLIEAEKAAKDLPKEEANLITEGIKKIEDPYNAAENALKDAENKFENALNIIINEHEEFINSLINDYNKFLNSGIAASWSPNDRDLVTKLIGESKNKIYTNEEEVRKILNNPDKRNIQNIQQIKSIRQLRDDISNYIQGLGLNDVQKQELQNILQKDYQDTIKKYEYKISSEINESINKYREAENALGTLQVYEKLLDKPVLKIRRSLGVYGDEKVELAMLSKLEESKKGIEILKNLVNERIQSIEKFRATIS
ncbi:MAG: hypothetical protein RXN79_02155 [Candidatus Nanopusillus sp.]